MLKKLFLFVFAFSCLMAGNTQKLRSQVNDDAKFDELNQLDKQRVDVNLNGDVSNQSRAAWTLAYYLDVASNNIAFATDGVNLYTSTMAPPLFTRYNMDGSNPETFSITGLTRVRDITYDGNIFYIGTQSMNIERVDLATGTRFHPPIVVNYAGQGMGTMGNVASLAYDPSLDNGNGGLWICDWYNIGAITMQGNPLIQTVNIGFDFAMGLAFDPYSDPDNPCLYYLCNAPNVKQFDINTRTVTTFIKSLAADNPTTGNLSGQGAFSYNNNEGKFLFVGMTPVSSGGSLAMAYELCDMALPAAPAPVLNLIITPADEGELSAEIAWTNPSTTEEGGILFQLTAVDIYQDGVLVHTVNNPPIGGPSTYTVEVDVAGFYRFSLIARNSVGESEANYLDVWIGHDVPAGPDYVTLIKNGMVAELSWTPVTTSLHNGYFIATGIVYDVVRYPDEITVAENLTVTTFDDETITVEMYYYYRVISKNDYGTGGHTDSNVGVFCISKTIPWFEGFEDNDFNFPPCWEMEFVVGTYPWEVVKEGVNYTPTPFEGEYMVQMRKWSMLSEKTKLITPPIDLSVGSNYVLNFYYMPRGYTTTERLRVFYKNSYESAWGFLAEYDFEYNAYDRWHKIALGLPDVSDTYFIAFEAEVELFGVFLDAISIREVQFVTGMVTDGTDPIQGAKVEISGTGLPTVTDDWGFYEILDVEFGDYEISVTKLGYYDVTEEIEISTTVTTKDFVLDLLPLCSVSGKVTSSDAPNGLEGVKVTLSGYYNYTTITDASGDYLFEDVYGDKTYNVEAYKLGYITYNSTVSVNIPEVTYNITIGEFASPVINPAAVDNETNAVISWGEPIFGTPATYRYDSGVLHGNMGYSGFAPMGTFGSCHKANTALTKIQWFLTDDVDVPASHVNIFIIALGDDGKPTKNVIHSEMMVPTKIMEWSEFEFTVPVETPNGFYMGVSRATGSYLSIGVAFHTEEWPFQSSTHFYTSNFEIFTWNELYAGMHNYNFMIRAEGISLGETVKFGYPIETSEPKAFTNYRVYRLPEGQEDDETAWTLLSDNITALSYTDNGWDTTAEGYHKWAVKAEYSGGELSIPRFTNRLLKGMEYTYTVNLTANSNDPVTGATVKLTNQDGNPNHVYTQNATGGTVVFTKVWNGTYDILITLSGFEPYTTTVIIDKDDSIDVVLEEIYYPAKNIVAVKNSDDVVVTWQAPTTNNKSRSFENYTVYRLTTDQPETNWTLLSDEVTELTYTDNGWDLLFGGEYQWAVKANYTTGQSEAVISNQLVKDSYNVTFEVFDNESQEPITDATIVFNGETLTGNTVKNVSAGTYEYTVSKDNYTSVTDNAVVVNQNITVPVNLDPVGINRSAFEMIALYPNPFTDEINISNSELVKSVQIMTIAGQKVKDIIFNGKSVATENLAEGVYFIIIESFSGKKLVHKMVKK